ncbi:GlxA family transcriptional regulator [Ferrovum myxofaciens]|uniref:GlxA family transcriptional regulator n=1 Tax=Ferrovum myxofaciens TaxID=416213 RepID=UPI002355270E|nr:helix-turn-helix domain-containing protein [Ferrovum myxofaciens]MBU6993519.1 helix-turn-helix domain-containing protein [Ferrovum myxofaciens]
MTILTIAVIAFEGISPFHLSIPCEVFGTDRSAAGVPRFDLRICAVEAGSLSTASGFTITVPYGLEGVASADTVIVPSWHDPQVLPPEPLLEALRAAHARGACLVGLCLGTFVLAAAGILDGHPATTHWLCARELAYRYPRIQINPDVLYVDDGDVVTSAGVSAGIDCCLHLLGKWYGAEIASRVARRMVVPLHRQGGQAQYIELPLPIEGKDKRLSAVLDWAVLHLDRLLDIDTLVEQARMSRRTFTRRFRKATGTTVSDWLRHQRLALAQRLLETTDQPIDLIAARAGFGSSVSMRQQFRDVLQISPSLYRREFRGQANSLGN